MSDFTEKLHSYDLFTFQLKIFNELLIFGNGIKTNGRAPVELKSYIYSVVPVDNITTESIKIEPTTQLEPTSQTDPTLNSFTQTEPTQNVKSLRRCRTKVKNKISESKYERLPSNIFSLEY